ncbi:MAG: endonuclease III [Verrucomicrobiae bacterium]|nr:endonuclease III [Verrucomicrobiae bacterium]
MTADYPDKVMKILAAAYPNARCELDYKTPVQLLVAVILSAQCTDKRVNMVTPELFRKYPDARAFASAAPGELEEAIRSTGFFRSKARNIQACCRALVERFGGKLPGTMDELISLAGVGRKTANVLLDTVFGRNEGVCVDTHVLRLSGRLGFSQASDPEGVERDLMKLFKRNKWGKISTWLIWHGRRRCNARRPDCGNCELFRLCPSSEKKQFLEKK